MIAVDTNLLVYAHRADAPFHKAADRCVTTLAQGMSDWAIPWPCLHEFLAVVTHPKIFRPPTPLPDAIEQITCWLESPHVHVLGASTEYWEQLKKVLTSSRATGPLIHDAHVAALCLQHRVTTLWTADRDFARFPQLRTHNPLLAD